MEVERRPQKVEILNNLCGMSPKQEQECHHSGNVTVVGMSMFLKVGMSMSLQWECHHSGNGNVTTVEMSLQWEWEYHYNGNVNIPTVGISPQLARECHYSGYVTAVRMSASRQRECCHSGNVTTVGMGMSLRWECQHPYSGTVTQVGMEMSTQQELEYNFSGKVTTGFSLLYILLYIFVSLFFLSVTNLCPLSCFSCYFMEASSVFKGLQSLLYIFYTSKNNYATGQMNLHLHFFFK